MTTAAQPTAPAVRNPHSEVHYFCTACHPHADRAICGARMRGEALGCDARPTCVVCAGMTDCPNHPGRTS